MMTSIIQSKLAPAAHASAWVERKPLLDLLTGTQLKRLSVVAAPSGFGKSTLLSEWYARAAHNNSAHRDTHSFTLPRAGTKKIAWLSLDPEDNEPVRFFGYLTAALRTVAPDFAPELCVISNEPHIAAGQFVTALTAIQHDMTVVLDDFQCLSDEHIARAFAFVVWRSPSHVHWIISGRSLAGLPLSQFRLQDQLHVIDQQSLSFDTDAIVQLGHKLRGITLSADQAEQLRVRTEGWAAGIKLTSLAGEFSNLGNTRAERPTVPPHDVAQYIDTTVLGDLDNETRHFLLVTSIAERFDARLCNALLGIDNAQAILERLQHRHLFIQPFGSDQYETSWYRYHTLFGECLRACLVREHGHRIPALHHAASCWFAAQGIYADALTHAFASDDRSAAIALLATCARSLLKSGDIAVVLRWAGKLTRSEILSSEPIATAYIASLIFCRRFNEAGALLHEFEAITATPTRIRTLKLMLAILSDTETECDLAGVDSDSTADAYLTGTLMTLQAYRLLRRNRFDIARRRALRAREMLQAQGSRHGAAYADMLVCLANRAVGNMDLVVAHCERMFADASRTKHDPAWVTAATALAHLRYEQNRLAEAEALSNEILPLLSSVSTVENFASAYITQARLKSIAGHHTDALNLLDYLHGVLESTRQHHFLAHVCHEKIRLHLRAGQRASAQTVACEFKLASLASNNEWSAARDYDSRWEQLGLAHAALLLSNRQYAECRATVKTLAASAQAVGYVYRAAPLYAALAACEWLAGNRHAAFDALNTGFALLPTIGFTRTAFDEAPLLPEVLSVALSQRKFIGTLPERYLEKFNGLFPTAQPSLRSASLRAHTIQQPLHLESLTERETKLLSLLAMGLSNQEISEHSQIALSTTKWHLKNVFSKLDVTTRTAALARARSLRLIE
jgi:LuxR family maltose regulon positive regulatory protein